MTLDLTERKAFESWWQAHTGCDDPAMHWNDVAGYMDEGTHTAWTGWQARAGLIVAHRDKAPANE